MCPWLIDFSFHSFLLVLTPGDDVSGSVSRVSTREDSLGLMDQHQISMNFQWNFLISVHFLWRSQSSKKKMELDKTPVMSCRSRAERLKSPVSNALEQVLQRFEAHDFFKAMEQGNDEQVASVTSLDEMFSDGPVVHFDDPRQPWLGLVQK